MSVSVVNGYVCFSGCDEAKARQGKDPDAPPGAVEDPKNKSAFDGQPATLLGGALEALLSSQVVSPAAEAKSGGEARRIDIRA